MAIKKWQLSCCALCQITCSDVDSIEELSKLIAITKEEAKFRWNPRNRASGERACFVITTPEELKLKANLEILGFKVVFEFPRRNGYPETGNLQMHTLSW